MQERELYGTVVQEKGAFFLEFQGMRQELPEGVMVDHDRLAKLVGQRVHVVFGNAPIVVLDHILCYVPADPWAWVGRVEPGIRQGILDGMVQAGLLTKERADQAMHMEG